MVLAIRGTASGSDFITDACSTSVPFSGDAYTALPASAWQITPRGCRNDASAATKIQISKFYSPDTLWVQPWPYALPCFYDLMTSMSSTRRKKVSKVYPTAKALLHPPRQLHGRFLCLAGGGHFGFIVEVSRLRDFGRRWERCHSEVMLCSVRRLLRRLNAASPAQPVLKSIGDASRSRQRITKLEQKQ